MASTGVSGKNGKAMVGSDLVAHLTKWSFNPTSNNHAFASSETAGYKSRVPGVFDASGSIEGKFKVDDAVYDLFNPGDAVNLALWINSTLYYYVPAVIDSFSLEVDVDEGTVIGWSAEFSLDGKWYYPGEVGAPSVVLP